MANLVVLISICAGPRSLFYFICINYRVVMIVIREALRVEAELWVNTEIRSQARERVE